MMRISWEPWWFDRFWRRQRQIRFKRFKESCIICINDEADVNESFIVLVLEIKRTIDYLHGSSFLRVIVVWLSYNVHTKKTLCLSLNTFCVTVMSCQLSEINGLYCNWMFFPESFESIIFHSCCKRNIFSAHNPICIWKFFNMKGIFGNFHKIEG